MPLYGCSADLSCFPEHKKCGTRALTKLKVLRPSEFGLPVDPTVVVETCLKPQTLLPKDDVLLPL